MYYLYILKSSTTGKFYICHTNDLGRRIAEHNSGQTKSTRNGRPWLLVYSKEYSSNIEAGREELRVKKMKSHRLIEEMINNSG
jgi:putative endonuclease